MTCDSAFKKYGEASFLCPEQRSPALLLCGFAAAAAVFLARILIITFVVVIDDQPKLKNSNCLGFEVRQKNDFIEFPMKRKIRQNSKGSSEPFF